MNPPKVHINLSLLLLYLQGVLSHYTLCMGSWTHSLKCVRSFLLGSKDFLQNRFGLNPFGDGLNRHPQLKTLYLFAIDEDREGKFSPPSLPPKRMRS